MKVRYCSGFTTLKGKNQREKLVLFPFKKLLQKGCVLYNAFNPMDF